MKLWLLIEATLRKHLAYTLMFPSILVKNHPHARRFHKVIFNLNTFQESLFNPIQYKVGLQAMGLCFKSLLIWMQTTWSHHLQMFDYLSCVRIWFCMSSIPTIQPLCFCLWWPIIYSIMVHDMDACLNDHCLSKEKCV